MSDIASISRAHSLRWHNSPSISVAPREDHQTQVRGSNDAEYQIYRANAEQMGWTVKSYDEWLNS